MDAMGKLMEESTKSGEMIELAPAWSTRRAHASRLAGGKITVTDGPFTEAKEVFGGSRSLSWSKKLERNALSWKLSSTNTKDRVPAEDLLRLSERAVRSRNFSSRQPDA